MIRRRWAAPMEKQKKKIKNKKKTLRYYNSRSRLVRANPTTYFFELRTRYTCWNGLYFFHVNCCEGKKEEKKKTSNMYIYICDVLDTLYTQLNVYE